MSITERSSKRNIARLKSPTISKRPRPSRKSPLTAKKQLQQERVRNRKGVKDFWGKFKDGIIDLFKEEEDHAL